MEITARALFALNRPWLPVIAAVIPVTLNAAITLRLNSARPQLLGVGASIGLLAGFAFLFLMVRVRRRRWLEEG
jgi:peptidoglycan biosynthesis protein MviN/MurJ (putative lipid II flippase)